jgi:hypothetical protein
MLFMVDFAYAAIDVSRAMSFREARDPVRFLIAK